LQLITSLISGSVLSCNFARDGGNEVAFYQSSGGGCVPDVSSNEHVTVCQEDGSVITFTYTIKSPLRNDVNYLVTFYLTLAPNFIKSWIPW